MEDTRVHCTLLSSRSTSVNPVPVCPWQVERVYLVPYHGYLNQRKVVLTVPLRRVVLIGIAGILSCRALLNVPRTTRKPQGSSAFSAPPRARQRLRPGVLDLLRDPPSAATALSFIQHHHRDGGGTISRHSPPFPVGPAVRTQDHCSERKELFGRDGCFVEHQERNQTIPSVRPLPAARKLKLLRLVQVESLRTRSPCDRNATQIYEPDEHPTCKATTKAHIRESRHAPCARRLPHEATLYS